MVGLNRTYYIFLGIHSLLIGLFPFYIPVYLYTKGTTLAGICFFISITGIGFCLSLYAWDRISKKVSLRTLIIFSFVSELLLLSIFFLEHSPGFLLLAGLSNGIFNCNFWIIQRLLFLGTVTQHNSGRKFGNFQLFVMVILKIGIFLGGILLAKGGYLPLYLVSLTMVLITILSFSYIKMSTQEVITGKREIPLSVPSILSFTDRFRSKIVFIIDGVFLYLESYFWLISLFLLVDQSYWKLGVLVIVLSLFFGTVFVVIKNKIDRLPVGLVYKAAVGLYAFSWIVRGMLSYDYDKATIFALLALITFCTSIFRLAFNKRFFDQANMTISCNYILIKSYYSQIFLAICCAILGFYLLNVADVVGQLSRLYFMGAFLSLFYLFYRKPEKNKNEEGPE